MVRYHVEIFLEPGKGRGLRASRSGKGLEPGTLIITERPYCYALLNGEEENHCHYCLAEERKDEKLLLCPGCTTARYCNEQCKKSAELDHKSECRGYRQLMLMPYHLRLIGRIIYRQWYRSLHHNQFKPVGDTRQLEVWHRGPFLSTDSWLILLPRRPVLTASSDPCLPLCNRAEWSECLHDTMAVNFQYPPGTCILCDGQEESMVTVGTSRDRTASCLIDTALGIRRHPFGVLSAKKLRPFADSPLESLALLDDEITDVEEGSLSGFSSLNQLSLDFNRLTHVKQRWFTGVEELRILGLSNNRIAEIDPGCFRNMSMLMVLNLENNLLQVVDSGWFLGLSRLAYLYLGGNDIASISPSAFIDMLVYQLYLEKNALSCLDWGLSQVFESNLRVSGDRLMTVYDTTPHRMVWSLAIHKKTIPDAQVITVEVPNFYLCVVSDLRKKLSLVWKFDLVQTIPRHESRDFPDLCIGSHRSPQKIVRLPRFVVIATDASPDELAVRYPDKCRLVWKHNAGITVAFKDDSVVQVVSMGVGNSTMTDVAILFDITKDTRAVGTHASTDYRKSIPCMVICKRNSSLMTFNVSPVPKEPQKACPTRRGDTDQAGNLLTIPDDPNTESRPILVTVVVSTVGTLSLIFFVALLLKVCLPQSQRSPKKHAPRAEVTQTRTHHTKVDESSLNIDYNTTDMEDLAGSFGMDSQLGYLARVVDKDVIPNWAYFQRLFGKDLRMRTVKCPNCGGPVLPNSESKSVYEKCSRCEHDDFDEEFHEKVDTAVEYADNVITKERRWCNGILLWFIM
uniref:MYND-type domain-containing protein n=1 Tax=Branchiostoma floridae TaxID=7739 RepID=C3Y8I9_BRAFL|eukprot:XP_002607416.1 hypothetical protein BRAFLDRAFT_69832 [Branchiostoma floridae]